MKEKISEAVHILSSKAHDGSLTQADTLFAIASGVLHVAFQLCEINAKLDDIDATISRASFVADHLARERGE